MNDLYCVIMAGGAGTRFWPASTEQTPKQLLTLVGDRSLLQMAVDRACAVAAPERVLVVTNALLAEAVRAQLPELPAQNIVAEPSRRDTAAAVALAALIVRRRGGKQVAILTADHLISPVEAFADAVKHAVAATTTTPAAIVTFGIVPTYPSTGFGYVELESSSGNEARPVLRFVEKPDAVTAAGYLASGRFLWNSGMFVFGVDAMINALRASLPKHLDTLAPVVDDDLPAAAFAAAFAKLDKISIDKGVMEKHSPVLCVPARFAWSDVGSFPALAEHLPNDDKGNAHRGVLRTLDARDNVVWCEDASEEVAVVGVEGLVVVRAGKRTLVMPKSRAEDVKKLVEALEKPK
ncbi:MAG: mannose-1-phosphate guanylyltransferase [Deltaproteobacteria bacterium]|nr:mannose-1-phosphate guanylyltransferase [Deltaproteobacteria bacterium]